MIRKFVTRDLLNAQYHLFLVSACAIFKKHNIDFDRLEPLYDGLQSHAEQMEISLAMEKRNEKIREKNEMDRRRDRMHSRLFNYLKYILYDEEDARFDDAQTVINILKDLGNPTRLPENEQSSLMITIENRLENVKEKIQAIGATDIVEQMNQANRTFMNLEKEAREIATQYKIENAPPPGNVRKQADQIYKMVVDALNAYAKMPHKSEKYNEMTAEMNVLVDKYVALIAARKRRNK